MYEGALKYQSLVPWAKELALDAWLAREDFASLIDTVAASLLSCVHECGCCVVRTRTHACMACMVRLTTVATSVPRLFQVAQHRAARRLVVGGWTLGGVRGVAGCASSVPPPFARAPPPIAPMPSSHIFDCCCCILCCCVVTFLCLADRWGYAHPRTSFVAHHKSGLSLRLSCTLISVDGDTVPLDPYPVGMFARVVHVPQLSFLSFRTRWTGVGHSSVLTLMDCMVGGEW